MKLKFSKPLGGCPWLNPPKPPKLPNLLDPLKLDCDLLPPFSRFIPFILLKPSNPPACPKNCWNISEGSIPIPLASCPLKENLTFEPMLLPMLLPVLKFMF